MIVTVFLNDAAFESYHSQTATFSARYALEIDAPSEWHALEEAFRILNIDHPSDYRYRSLSVGDVARIGKNWFACDPVGWRRIPPPKADLAPR